VIHVGDTWWNGFYPFIDYSTGGNIDGMIKASEANVAAVTDKTIVIPGHGNPVSNKAELSAALAAFQSGALNPVIDRALPLSDIASGQ